MCNRTCTPAEWQSLSVQERADLWPVMTQENRRHIWMLMDDAEKRALREKLRPIMIHRAPFGSMERFVAVLLEHTGGKFPLWLSPDQAVVLPISEKFNDYAKKVSDYLNNSDIRATVDDRNEKIGRKIRDNELRRIPPRAWCRSARRARATEAR